MPTLTITDFGVFEAEEGQRLVKAIEGVGVDIGHRCGGKARCTTCRVRFISDEPDRMTQAEFDKLTERGLLGEVRLSCQIVFDREMHVQPLLLLSEQENWADAGPEPAEYVEPEAVWLPVRELALNPGGGNHDVG